MNDTKNIWQMLDLHSGCTGQDMIRHQSPQSGALKKKRKKWSLHWLSIFGLIVIMFGSCQIFTMALCVTIVICSSWQAVMQHHIHLDQHTDPSTISMCSTAFHLRQNVQTQNQSCRMSVLSWFHSQLPYCQVETPYVDEFPKYMLGTLCDTCKTNEVYAGHVYHQI